MRHNHQPIWFARLTHLLRRYYINTIITPQFDEVAEGLLVYQPKSLILFGHHIRAGKHLHIISQKLKPVQLCTWQSKQQQGQIVLGDHVLISPGVQINSASSISIGDNCMIAQEVTINDSDWHGVYNRTRPFKCSSAIKICENVWLGQRAIIGKGVSIGENSIVAAGSVVVESVPANSIVGGNPAKLLKKIDPDKRMLTRAFLFNQTTDYNENQRLLNEYLCQGNTSLNWLRTLLFPKTND